MLASTRACVSRHSVSLPLFLSFALPLEYVTGASVAGYIVACIFHGAFTTLLSIPHYVFMLPTFVCTFMIYSFCNMNDVSWGTKEGEFVCGLWLQLFAMPYWLTRCDCVPIVAMVA